ncbi:hypothetical protein [Costertonia aggregata]|uniref:Uncharacterized protein n=1 Tax=Costertonia aggregata TaxID=343403 RepID=A0A7H9ASR0_9FLAO|nr:hypothetical protein [Costertonia aggregata]QLG46521.1 hypothetical protein HYG79_14585 [Costertonia aggregata]
MAEIKVEKKNNYWGWIIGGLAVIGIIAWFLMADTDGAPDVNELEQVSTNESELESPSYDEEPVVSDNVEGLENPEKHMTDFVAFVGDKSRMGIDHEYTSEGLVKLVNATIERALVNDVDINMELQSAIEKAEAITNDPMDGDHADKIKKAYLSITDVIEKVQEEKYPQLSDDVEELRQAAQNIDPSVLTLDQKEKVNGYFKEAADILQKMNSV